MAGELTERIARQKNTQIERTLPGKANRLTAIFLQFLNEFFRSELFHGFGFLRLGSRIIRTRTTDSSLLSPVS